MLTIQSNFDMRHEGSITRLHAWSGARKNHGFVVDIVTPARQASEAREQVQIMTASRICFVLLCGILALACLSILVAVPFGMFPGEVFESVVAAVFGLLLALGPGGLVAMTLVRGPVDEIRIDRATGRVDVVERDILDGKTRSKTAQAQDVRLDTVAFDSKDFVVIGTRALMGFQLWIDPASANRSAADLTKELNVALGRNIMGGHPVVSPTITSATMLRPGLRS